MELTNEMLTRVMQESIGNDILPVTSLLTENEELSELKLAKLLNVEVNEARRLLYKLHHHNLVKFQKKKDQESGWYTYYWRLNLSNMDLLVNKTAQAAIEKISKQIHKESNNHFFVCNNKCFRLDHDAALAYGFKCPECGSLLDHHDNSRKIEMLKYKLNDIIATYNLSEDFVSNIMN